jgi:pilus assembly protein Flp/PilA
MLIIMVNKLKGLVVEEHGQGMTEYGLVLGLIAVAAVGAIVLLRGHIVDLFNNVQENVGSAATEVNTGNTAS